MGLAKAEWIEGEDRGWHGRDTHVCPDCVEDEFLKGVISGNAVENECDYCGKQSEEAIAAPFDVLMEKVANTLHYYYAEPGAAGVPWDGGPVIEPTDTADALFSLPFEAEDQLFEEVVGAFTNLGWVRAANGHWSSTHLSKALDYSWTYFTHTVKHRYRYFFYSMAHRDPFDMDIRSPAQLLGEIGGMCQGLGLVRELDLGQTFYRVRERLGEADWEVSEETAGAPPDVMAGAGRMNPAGISYLYMSFEVSTALAEVLGRPPCKAVVTTFKSLKKLIVLDLSILPSEPSIFDDNKRAEREAVLFLQNFVEEITKPLQKDGREHISYVPSQVVSEYFAKVFKIGGGDGEGVLLDGIVYPSAVADGGKNIVLFPRPDSLQGFSEVVGLEAWEERHFATWGELSRALT
jgi:RES domain-containing protein